MTQCHLSADAFLALDPVSYLSNRYAAIAVVGPRADELLAACDFEAQRTRPLVLRETEAAFEVLVPSADGPAEWERLLAVGVPFRIACVGLDALAHLAASRRLHNSVGAEKFMALPNGDPEG